MAVDILSSYAVGGAQRPDSFSGLDPAFASSLGALFQAAPADIQQVLRVTSGFRSPERQQQLWDQALAKYGSPEAARKWVAPPGRSQHNHGSAVDLKYLDPRAQAWAHENAAKYGLHFPMSHEPWHIEPVGARGGQRQAGGVAVAQAPVAAEGMAAPTGPAQQAFGDVVAPRAPVSFASIIDNYSRQRQAAEEEHQARQARLAELFAVTSA